MRVHTNQGREGAKIPAIFAEQAGLMAAMGATRNHIAKKTARLLNQSIRRRWDTCWSQEADKKVIAPLHVTALGHSKNFTNRLDAMYCFDRQTSELNKPSFNHYAYPFADEQQGNGCVIFSVP